MTTTTTSSFTYRLAAEDAARLERAHFIESEVARLQAYTAELDDNRAAHKAAMAVIEKAKAKVKARLAALAVRLEAQRAAITAAEDAIPFTSEEAEAAAAEEREAQNLKDGVARAERLEAKRAELSKAGR